MKMKKIFLLAMVALTGVATSCQYDDDELWDNVNNLADRVTSLEAVTKQMNSDIAAMKTIISALEKQVMVSEVEELADGYIIHFTDGTKATIKNGADGKDGANGTNGSNGANGSDGKDGADGEDGKDGKDGKDAPVIGVKQDNGVYYWTLTLDGKTEWLTDEAGNKMRVTGEDGKDGADGEDGKDGADGENGKDGVDGKAPVVTIVNGIWHINGQSTGKSAKGDKGQDATDSMFESIVKENGKLIFNMVDGKSFEVPVLAEISYVDSYDDPVDPDNVVMGQDEQLELTYSVLNFDEVSVEVFSADNRLEVSVDEVSSKLTIQLKDQQQQVADAKIVLLYYNANQTITSVLKVTAGTVVTDEESLREAVNQGGVIVLTGDLALTSALTISDNVTLDLGGYTLTGDVDVTAGTFTLQNGKLYTTAEGADAIEVKGENTDTEIVVNIASTAIVDVNGGDVAVVVPGSNKSEKITINVEGKLGTTSTEYAALQVNGNAKGVTVNVKDGFIINENNTAIYFPAEGELNISGGYIVGHTAVYMKSGELNISGGNLIAEGPKEVFVHGTSGCYNTGDALVIEACDYPGGVPVVRSITGGNFVSQNALAVGTYQHGNYTLGNKNFITGGRFSDPSACYYLGEDADVTIDMRNHYTGAGFETVDGQKVTLNLNGFAYTVTAPLVGSPGTQTLGFQFNQGSTVEIYGGIITSSDAKMLIQNYSNLTLNNVTLEGKIPNNMNGQAYYVLSNNCGVVNINAGTVITAPKAQDGQVVFAFDVCKYSTYSSVTVNVNAGAAITGNVEYTGVLNDDDETTNQKLYVNEGAEINGNLVVPSEANKSAAEVGVTIHKDATINGEGWYLNEE